MEDVDVVETEPLQRRLDLADHRFGRLVAAPEDGLGRDDQLVSIVRPHRGTDDLFGAVGLGGVEEIDAEVDRRPGDRHAVVEARTAAEAEAAVAAATKPGDTDLEAGFSEDFVFHHRSLSTGRVRISRRKMMRLVLPVLVACFAAAPAFAQAPDADAQCEALVRLALPQATVTQATVERSGAFHEERGPGGKPIDHGDLPPFCRVLGTSTPVPGSKIGFEIWLPLAGWTGRLQAIGNGAYDDRIYYAQMAQRVRAGDVVVRDRYRPQGRRPEVWRGPSRGHRRLGRWSCGA